MSSVEEPQETRDKSPHADGETQHHVARSNLRYESTPDGDVVVVEPSFDAEDNDGRGPNPDNNGRVGVEARSSPSKDGHGHSHRRNLSEHFYDATSLSDHPASQKQAPSPNVGQKHRRGFSGGVSNPAEAHRRINSIGNAAAVQRRPYIQERHHQRVDSAGLDMLTAAADVSREELAAAADARGRPPAQGQWEGPEGGGAANVEVISYNHSAGSRTGPPPPVNQSRPYPPGPPHPSYYNAHGYPHPSYPPPAFYSHGGYQRQPAGYPVQYARAPDSYSKYPHQAPLQQPVLERPGGARPPATGAPTVNGKGPLGPPPMAPPQYYDQGAAHGQVFPPPPGEGDYQSSRPYGGEGVPAAPGGEDDKNWVPPVSVYTGGPSETGDHPLKKHHRVTSSSVSFLGLDMGGFDSSDAAFLKNLHASNGKGDGGSSNDSRGSPDVSEDDGTGKLAPGGTSKRIRRKCTVEGCQNRVVQGGLCISHGARRKQCKHPGCTKNVKKAGLCSTHGPARKRCEIEGCGKVAVQGGRCIAHGAKKKLCSMEGCSKQAILNGMCKKHHDQSRKDGGPQSSNGYDLECKVIEEQDEVSPKSSRKPTHTRGLSLFQEMSAEAVGNILNDDDVDVAPAPGHQHRSTFSREFGSLY